MSNGQERDDDRVPSSSNGDADVELPSISVVVPTMVARVDDLRQCLDALAAVDYPRFEIVLVDNRRDNALAEAGEDALPELVRGRRPVRVVRETRPGISAARNAGVAASSADVIAFTDDDVRVDSAWLRAIGQRFAAEPTTGAVTGLILPAELETPAQVWFEQYYGGFGGERTYAPLTLRCSGFPGTRKRSRVVAQDLDGNVLRTFAIYGSGAYGAGANMAFRRSTLEDLGGFDVSLGTGTVSRGGEDLAALIRLLWNGAAVSYEPGAVVHHRHRRTLAELEHQLRGNGVGFTAMLTALVIEDPRHILGVAGQLPLAARELVRQNMSRLRGHGRDGAAVTGPTEAGRMPSDLVRTEVRGYFGGPRAYLRSRRLAFAQAALAAS